MIKEKQKERKKERISSFGKSKVQEDSFCINKTAIITIFHYSILRKRKKSSRCHNYLK
jgi:hypothetical protein